MAAQALPLAERMEAEDRPGLIPARLSLVRRPGETQRALAATKGLPVPGAYQWHRGELLAMARPRCTLCWGTGARPTWGSQVRPCKCVYQHIFRACLREYEQCREGATKWQVTYEGWLDSDGRSTSQYGLPREEFCCDFELIAKRALTPRQYRIFRMHVLQGADGTLCGKRLRIDRGTFYHEVYRMQETLGWAFAELQPYPLFPCAEYFRSRGAKFQVQGEKNPWPWAA
jgi:hypothetical protein